MKHYYLQIQDQAPEIIIQLNFDYITGSLTDVVTMSNTIEKFKTYWTVDAEHVSHIELHCTTNPKLKAKIVSK